MKLLGYDYDYIVTDVTEGRSGNDERLGFIFDRNKIKFKGVAGELVLPENMLIMDEEKRRQFARTPFMCSFQSGWKNRSTAKRKQSRTGNHIFKTGQGLKIIICGSGAPFMEAIIFLYGMSLRSTLAIIIWLILKPFEKEGKIKPF